MANRRDRRGDERRSRGLAMAVLLAALAGIGCDGVFIAHGRVVSRSGRPISGVEVAAYDENMRVAARTDSNGCFQLARVCSPWKHAVPIRVGGPESAPVATVQAPVMEDLRLLMTVAEDQPSRPIDVMVGGDIGTCATK